MHSCLTFERLYGLGDGERSLVVVPLVHVTGLIAQLWAMTTVAGTVVLMPRFDAGEALRPLAAEGITHLVAAPTVYVMLMARPGYRAVPSPGSAILGYGGAPMAGDTVRRLREWLPGARLHNTYGLTETASPATCLADADALARIDTVAAPSRSASAGRWTRRAAGRRGGRGGRAVGPGAHGRGRLLGKPGGDGRRDRRGRMAPDRATSRRSTTRDTWRSGTGSRT